MEADYLPGALNTAHHSPETESPDAAAAMFIRWIVNEPFQKKDKALWLIPTPHV